MNDYFDLVCLCTFCIVYFLCCTGLLSFLKIKTANHIIFFGTVPRYVFLYKVVVVNRKSNLCYYFTCTYRWLEWPWFCFLHTSFSNTSDMLTLSLCSCSLKEQSYNHLYDTALLYSIIEKDQWVKIGVLDFPHY